ncbi:cysteine--tRNA ligase [Umboniibacter marinipuniceus]|uniref:Cysteine--tRNA ligase n=1 Tax=Umboniibacter marinipuniceus TaxID=569599 RepID=A0A3M0A931_9GAMM|nr:cysteine--tRNA ligase [Umboniibacter marinipuniceus]RMA81106.1 cysteinyl-tRNA synthetase [Umboniibacter marinipuniceus]
MTLHLYNTQAGEKQRFEPIDANHIKMYVCGPTVYNRVHIGNARPVVVFDVLYRVLKALYPKVSYARNITDIDDKIMAAAKASGEEIGEITRHFAQAYAEDMAELKAQEPDIVPFATEHVPEMVAMIQALIKRNHAYESAGHVLFAVQTMDDYGSLSNRDLEDMLAGARVEVADYKRYAGDFVLWKPSKDDEPGWDSPWGRGRPGWHIECSAMIEKHLGRTIDIHGGGRDLVFPHHENEMAQSCCAHDGERFVNYWMHNGYVNIDGEKMSKSLGNFRMVNELLGEWQGEVLRFALLSAQYRSEVNFSQESLAAAKQTLDTFYLALRKLQDVVAVTINPSDSVVWDSLLDDLNTPNAVAALHGQLKRLSGADDNVKAEVKGQLLAAGALLGLFSDDPEVWFSAGTNADEGAEIDALVIARNEAKAAKDWAKADAVRDELNQRGIILEDGPNGTTWRKA